MNTGRTVFFQLLRIVSLKSCLLITLSAGTSQIWIAVCTYLIALIAHKKLQTDLWLRNFLHVVEVNMFKKITLVKMVSNALNSKDFESLKSQIELFKNPPEFTGQ